MRRIFLYGAGGHAKVVADSLKSEGKLIGGFIDDYSNELPILRYPVFSSIQDIEISETDSLIISIGSNLVRKKKSEILQCAFSNAIHAHSFISDNAFVKEGTVVMAGVSINADVEIGIHTIINTNASIDHDCIIGDYVHVSPNAALAGNVTVGEGTHIGIGACVIQGIRIGKWCTIGAGTVIIKDVPDGATVVGNPGRVIKQV